MRPLQPRAWLSGLGQASRSPWRHESVSSISSSVRSPAEAEAQPAESGLGDAQFLQLLSKSFRPAQIGDSAPATRPLLANLPAAADLMEQAVPQTPTAEPVYDLPTFMASNYPHAGVHPRNPAYDWRVWARSNLSVAPRASSAPQQQQQRLDAQQQLALLLQVDAHMQLPASREVITRLAKLELAHLWHYQQQQLMQAGAPATSASLGESAGSKEQQQQAAPSAATAAATPSSSSAATATASSPPAAAAPAAKAAETEVAADDDDIFAAADRKARERRAAAEAAAAAAVQQQAAAGGETAAVQSSKDPFSSLPPEVQLRLRELQRRAEAFGGKRGSLADVVRGVAEAFDGRVPSDLAPSPSPDLGDASAWLAPAAAPIASGRPGSGNPADVALLQQQQANPSASYWADHPMMSYTDLIVALAHREGAAARRAAAAGPAGSASIAAAVASLSASLPRAGSSSSSAAPPATPVLSLLLDYLGTKYQDLLHAWEVAARLEAAAARSQRAAARQSATVAVPATPEAALQQLLPPTLAAELERTWASDGSSSSASSSLSTWQQAREELLRQAAKVGAAGAAAVGESDPRVAAERAMAPLLAAAAAKHRALLGGDEPVAASVSGSGVGSVGEGSAAASAVGAAGAAGVVCFRETLVLDASSAFDDGSHDPRVTLEFSPARLAAASPALGGTWGAAFLRRLLAQPVWAEAAGSTSRPMGRKRRSDVARSAAMAAAYPLDVDRSYCRHTDTAVLSTARYGSREANRKLLLEHYAALLRATAVAAGGSAQ
ncbi:hypothetical protein Agub_g3855 [Astrephomene gubernaculifera]|uniref:Uncharacterized protein n=1 Tax=Astrephomene gubernaculifera TaxID=47775 RepID=A0AAD3DKK1_9CHLO|nr:hypothetical protein Agub_g3855 [Astrephomene gubernaculifera]